jgi:hypothetical protein
MDAEVSRRVRGEGSDDFPWMTIPKALAELDSMIAELPASAHGPLQEYRIQLLGRRD